MERELSESFDGNALRISSFSRSLLRIPSMPEKTDYEKKTPTFNASRLVSLSLSLSLVTKLLRCIINHFSSIMYTCGSITPRAFPHVHGFDAFDLYLSKHLSVLVFNLKSTRSVSFFALLLALVTERRDRKRRFPPVLFTFIDHALNRSERSVVHTLTDGRRAL